VNAPDRRIGLTSTVPVEAVYAAGLVPIDLNNAFIADPRRDERLALAEREGFPASACAWIKGIFGVVVAEGIPAVIAVTTGDCSNTVALAEVLADRGVRVVRFGFPERRTRFDVEQALSPFLAVLGVTAEEAEKQRDRLAPVRDRLRAVDALTWYGDRVTGEENHRFLVAASDFGGDPEAFDARVEAFVAEARARDPLPAGPRIGIVGVPPIADDFHAFLAARGARVVFNEVQRQFAMPGPARDLIDQYLRYTYPYDFAARAADIARESRRRGCVGLIHYVQSFCHRGIEDILLRKRAALPVLTLEGDRPGPLDGRSRVRIEAFLETLGDRG
jgi:benzoyl-CoA reductase/2-hydroxyglutaryl-CoA dehydratase subunit BcrC/BadD/HgdB